MKEIIFPVIKFMDNDKYIASVRSKFLSDKSFLKTKSKFNSNFEIIDCIGNRFIVTSLEKQNFSLLDSIKNVGIIYRMQAAYTYIDAVSLEELKERIFTHVKSHKSFWSSLNDGRGLKRMIMEAKDYQELILMFR
ncbi:MAG: hypothetical protein WAT92_23750 [Saprospiraceae bacterium]